MLEVGSLNAKIPLQEKENFVRIAESIGLTPSAAIRVLVKRFNEVGGFPFDVRQVRKFRSDDPRIATVTIRNGRAIVPASWRDDDDEEE